MADRSSDDPQVIERDIERTQDSIGETVDKIEQKLTPREVTRSLLGDSGQEWVREGLRMARDNPVPVAMMAIGAIWLFAASDSPLIKHMSDRISRAFSGDDGLRPRSEEPAPIGPPPARGA